MLIAYLISLFTYLTFPSTSSFPFLPNKALKLTNHTNSMLTILQDLLTYLTLHTCLPIKLPTCLFTVLPYPSAYIYYSCMMKPLRLGSISTTYILTMKMRSHFKCLISFLYQSNAYMTFVKKGIHEQPTKTLI